MAVAASVGGTLVGLSSLDSAVTNAQPGMDEFLGAVDWDEGFVLAIDNERAISADALKPAWSAASEVVPYEGIGFGKPLTLAIRTVYVGDYPDSMRWVPGDQKADVLVTSAHKPFQVFEAAPRAIHLLKEKPERCGVLEFAAHEAGSKLVLYSPSVTDTGIVFTLELTADRDLNQQIGPALTKALSAAGALPVFAPAAPYLVAAGAVVPIVETAAAMLARPTTFFSETVELNFEMSGLARTQPGALVLFPDGDESPLAGGYELDDDFKLVRCGTGEQYSGPMSYVVISLDGSEQPALEGWSAVAATGELLERFFTPDELIGQALDVAVKSLSLYNDVEFRSRAMKAKRRSEEEKDPKVAQRQKDLYEAYKKNIQSEAMRDTLA